MTIASKPDSKGFLKIVVDSDDACLCKVTFELKAKVEYGELLREGWKRHPFFAPFLKAKKDTA